MYRNPRKRPISLVFLGALLAVLAAFLPAMLHFVGNMPGEYSLAAIEPAVVIALTNAAREQNNAPDLQENAALDAAAQAKANDMAAKGYFSHTGPDGKTPWQWISQAGYHFHFAGENLAVRFYNSADVVDAWMASPSHRANIVKPVYADIGIGVAQGLFQGAPALYIVQDFGAPLATPGVAKGAPLTNSSVVSTTATASTALPKQVIIPERQAANVIENTGVIDSRAASI